MGQKQVFQCCFSGRPVALTVSIQAQFVTNGLAASVNLCFLCFLGKFRHTFSRDAMQSTAGLQISRKKWRRLGRVGAPVRGRRTQASVLRSSPKEIMLPSGSVITAFR